MILRLQPITSDATLNNFDELDSIDFIPGYPVTLVMRLTQKDRDLRYIPNSAATFVLNLLKSDGTFLTTTPGFLNTDDKSLISVSLTSSDTMLLVSQNLQVDITEPAGVSVAQHQGGLRNSNSLGC